MTAELVIEEAARILGRRRLNLMFARLRGPKKMLKVVRFWRRRERLRCTSGRRLDRASPFRSSRRSLCRSRTSLRGLSHDAEGEAYA